MPQFQHFNKTHLKQVKGKFYLEEPIYKLVKKSQSYPKGTLFRVRELPFTWTVNEYVSSKLYSFIMPGLIDDAVLFDSINKKKKPQWVCQNDIKLAVKYDSRSTSIMSKDIFYGLINGTERKYTGFILAYLTSVLFNDVGVARGSNFGIKSKTFKGPHEITRYNMDKSLSFFFIKGISSKKFCYNEHSMLYQIVQRNNNTEQFALKLLQAALDTPMSVDTISWGKIYVEMCNKADNKYNLVCAANIRIQPFNKIEIIDALDKIQKNLDPDKAKKQIQKSISEIHALSGDTPFAEEYFLQRIKHFFQDVNQIPVNEAPDTYLINDRWLYFASDAQRQGYVLTLRHPVQHNSTLIQQISDFIFENISRRFIQLMDLFVCLKVQVALDTDDLALLKGAANQRRDWENTSETYGTLFPNMLCSTPDKIDFETYASHLCDFIQGHNGIVADTLYSFCSKFYHKGSNDILASGQDNDYEEEM